MEYLWWAVLIGGVMCLYRSTRNICAFPVVYYWHLLPSAYFAPASVLPLLALSALAKGTGALCVNNLAGFKPAKELERFRNKPIENICGRIRVFRHALFFGFLLTIGMGVFYFANVGVSVLMEDPAHARLQVKAAVAGWFIFQRFLRVMFPLLIMVYFLANLGAKQRPYVRLGILGSLCATFLVFTGFRGNVGLFMFYPFVMLAGLLSRQASRKMLWTLGALTLSAALAINLLMKPDEEFMDVMTELWSRIMATGFDGITFVVEELVPREGFFGGATFWGDLWSVPYRAGLTSDEAFNFSAYVARELLGMRYVNEQAGVGAEGEFYANFGFPGVLLGGLVLGGLAQTLYIWTLRGRKDVVLTPVIVELHLMLVVASGGPLVATILDYSMTIALMTGLLLGTYVFLSLPSRRVDLRLGKRTA